MEKLYSPKEIAERYGCSVDTARDYMRRMEHMEKPLRVRESVLRAWECERTRQAGDVCRAEAKRRRRPIPLCPAGIIPQGGKHIVSRVRPSLKDLNKLPVIIGKGD